MDKQYQQLVLEALQRYLHGRRAMPEVTFNERLPPGVAGMRQGDKVKVAPGAGMSTLVHELVHSAQSAMDSQYVYDQRNPQFAKAFEQLSGGKGRYLEAIRESATKLAPEWMQTEDPYRTTGRELQAFGLGNQFKDPGTEVSWNAAQHVDPTMATEFMILLDLATRASEAGSQGRWYRQEERLRKKEEQTK